VHPKVQPQLPLPPPQPPPAATPSCVDQPSDETTFFFRPHTFLRPVSPLSHWETPFVFHHHCGEESAKLDISREEVVISSLERVVLVVFKAANLTTSEIASFSLEAVRVGAFCIAA